MPLFSIIIQKGGDQATIFTKTVLQQGRNLSNYVPDEKTDSCLSPSLLISIGKKIFSGNHLEMRMEMINTRYRKFTKYRNLFIEQYCIALICCSEQ